MSCEEKSCITNLGVCEASCCKVLSFQVRTFPNSPLTDYYLKHGCKVDRINREYAFVRVPMKCPQLTSDNLCGLHGKPSKPVMCQDLNEKTAQKGGYYLTEGCIYKKG